MATDIKKTAKRDALSEIEKRMQAKWAAEKVFECDAPESEGAPQPPKFMVTFPYPYMNGRLHLGHSFSLSKAEFAVGYQRLRGKKTLFPFGFHCTGMPIKACADKLANELMPAENGAAAPEKSQLGSPKHAKVAAKTGGETSQVKIMKSIGVSTEDIPKFTDPKYWLEYFPPKAIADLKSMGIKIDWRRSFITTDANPFYDAFIQWQFRQLKAQDKVRYGKRYTIYSPKDGQPCMDHDRASGEGVDPQEYLGVKLLLIPPSQLCDSARAWPEALQALASMRIYMIAATLRPETLYGLTNVWIGPEVTYGAYRVSETDVYLCTERAARNMSYQGHSMVHGVCDLLCEVSGHDLIGLACRAPLTSLEHVYVYPLMNVLATKGTGIISSVPSDSPDDFAALRDLRDKASLRQKFGLAETQVLPYQAIPVIQTDGYATPFMAEILCQQMGVKSQNDRDGLAKAKLAAYRDGFYGGTMLVGPFAGKTVQEAKPLIREAMIADGTGIAYSEPENPVMSRSGDECVVALVDQWYIVYGELEWKAAVTQLVERMNLYHPEVRHQMNNILDWLGQWACSRSFGLGTKLPWDPQYLIESLSDSTIYMTYYTVAHILHQGSLDGSTRPFGIAPEQMTDDVWTYVLNCECTTPPPGSTIPLAVLQRMKREFNYFYPMDLRVSGKDLLFNHLTFMLYNHTALFPSQHWPLSMRVNGHLLLNSAKMSKSTGNFMTMAESVEQFTADGTRFALADAGDTLDDANFLVETCNTAILRLYTQLEFATHALSHAEAYRTGPASEYNFFDRVFNSRISRLIRLAEEAYEQMMFREALKYGFYELQNARDRYRDVTEVHGSCKMHLALVRRFIEVQALLLAPLTPHFSEHVWSELLRRPASIMVASWPTLSPIDEHVLAADDYLIKVSHALRLSLNTVVATEQKKAAKRGSPSTTVSRPNGLELYVADAFPDWQERLIDLLRASYNEAAKSFKEDDVLVAELAQAFDIKSEGKKVMPFLMDMKKRVELAGPKAFSRVLPFNELAILCDTESYFKDDLELQELRIVLTSQASSLPLRDAAKAATAVPGEPVPVFYHC